MKVNNIIFIMSIFLNPLFYLAGIITLIYNIFPRPILSTAEEKYINDNYWKVGYGYYF